MAEDRQQRAEGSGQAAERRGQRTEDRGQAAGSRGQAAEGRGERTGSRGQRAEGSGQAAEGYLSVCITSSLQGSADSLISGDDFFQLIQRRHTH